MKWTVTFITIISLFVAACGTMAPTPILIGSLVEQNNEVVALYVACSDGANYNPSKESCDSEMLGQKVDSTMSLAKIFISADIKQPQGYDIYLATAMIYFRIAQRNGNDYSEAERIARQFFEIQKAHSGYALPPARFYWAAMSTGHASWQWQYDKMALDSLRKTDLLLCLAEGRIGLTDTQWLDGARRIRLTQYIETLTLITSSIK